VGRAAACAEGLSGELGLDSGLLLRDPVAAVTPVVGGLKAKAGGTASGLCDALVTRGGILARIGAPQAAEQQYAAAKLLAPDAKAHEAKPAKSTPSDSPGEPDKVPCSIITGFLGSMRRS